MKLMNCKRWAESHHKMSETYESSGSRLAQQTCPESSQTKVSQNCLQQGQDFRGGITTT